MITTILTFITGNPITSYLTYCTPLVLYTCNDNGNGSTYQDKLITISINTLLIAINPIIHVFILHDMSQKLYGQCKFKK